VQNRRFDEYEGKMTMRVLVTYATKHESTAEIAAKIGEILTENGLAVDVSEIHQVNDLGSYTVVIVGSAIYFGDWHKAMIGFLRTNEELLIMRDVWIFSSGPTGEKDTTELLAEWRFPARLRPLLKRIQPHDAVVFFGNLDPDKLNFIEKGVVKVIKAPIGDYRDWDEIQAWATKIANRLNASTEGI
jgi:menaquinone-dependent protoporphyrinogen oxidase